MNVQLVIFKEDGTRRDLEMKRDSIVIGRSGDCDYQIPLSVISRRHCKLSRKGERLILKDLGSSNGTFLNDKRVLQAEVKPGDQMKVGPVIFTVVINGVPTEIEPVVTVLDSKAEAAPAAEGADALMGSSVAAAAAVPETTGSDMPTEGSAVNSDEIDIVASLDNLAMDESKAGEIEVDDAGLSPLAELEELAKQRKK